jgi:son of sevenless-like protein
LFLRIQALLLTEENLETRTALLKHIVRTLRFLLEYRNFNGALQIVSALNSSAVFRLKKTFEALSEYVYRDLEQFKDNWYS